MPFQHSSPNLSETHCQVVVVGLSWLKVAGSWLHGADVVCPQLECRIIGHFGDDKEAAVSCINSRTKRRTRLDFSIRKVLLHPSGDSVTIQRLPGWITSARAETPDYVAFLSGAALACVHLVVTDEKVPQDVWRARLALGAAEACAGLAGRSEGSAQLRDAVHLLRSGGHQGPAGEIFRQWSIAVGRQFSVANLGKALLRLTAKQIAVSLNAAGGTPVGRAAAVLEAVLAAAPRIEAAALILADATLAKSRGWDHVLPLLPNGLKARDLRQQGCDLLLACQRAVGTASGQAVTLATKLARAAAQLRALTMGQAREEPDLDLELGDPPPDLRWREWMRERRHPNIVSVALANKNARIAWSILARGEDYRLGQTAAGV